MSIYFFDCFDGEKHWRDTVGTDRDAEADLGDEAAALACALMCERMVDSVKTVTVTVRSGEGRQIYVARMSFVGTWTPRGSSGEGDGAPPLAPG